MSHWRIILALGCLAAGPIAVVPAADLTKVERQLRHEPTYKTKHPRYCLLVFGPNADYRVWLVLDGDILYVDRNGNGDLTESGESTGAHERESDPRSFKPVTILGADGKTEETLRFAMYGWFDYKVSKDSKTGKDSSDVSPSVSITWKGRYFGSWGDETGPCIWGRKPETAPILHIDGPLQMGFEIPAKSALKREKDGQFELSAGVGTKGLGNGAFVHLSYELDAIPNDVYPTAILEFPNKKAGGPPLTIQMVLKERC